MERSKSRIPRMLPIIQKKLKSTSVAIRPREQSLHCKDHIATVDLRKFPKLAEGHSKLSKAPFSVEEQKANDPNEVLSESTFEQKFLDMMRVLMGHRVTSALPPKIAFRTRILNNSRGLLEKDSSHRLKGLDKFIRAKKEHSNHTIKMKKIQKTKPMKRRDQIRKHQNSETIFYGEKIESIQKEDFEIQISDFKEEIQELEEEIQKKFQKRKDESAVIGLNQNPLPNSPWNHLESPDLPDALNALPIEERNMTENPKVDIACEQEIVPKKETKDVQEHLPNQQGSSEQDESLKLQENTGELQMENHMKSMKREEDAWVQPDHQRQEVEENTKEVPDKIKEEEEIPETKEGEKQASFNAVGVTKVDVLTNPITVCTYFSKGEFRLFKYFYRTGEWIKVASPKAALYTHYTRESTSNWETSAFSLLNKIPGVEAISTKKELASLLTLHSRLYPHDLQHSVPETFVMPQDLETYLSRHRVTTAHLGAPAERVPI